MDLMQIVTALGAGLLTFLSPCILPLIPLYLGYMGATLDQPGRNTWRVLPFILGFSVIFILFGMTATSVGKYLLVNQLVLKQVAGSVMILLGILMSGLLTMPLLNREFKLSFLPQVKSWSGAFVFGSAFALGWTPCTGPILASILIYAGTADTMAWGAILLACYSLGLGLPILAAAYFADRLLPRLLTLGSLLRGIQISGGLLMVILGLLIMIGKL